MRPYRCDSDYRKKIGSKYCARTDAAQSTVRKQEASIVPVGALINYRKETGSKYCARRGSDQTTVRNKEASIVPVGALIKLP